MPWTKCYGYNCESLRYRYTLRCCGNMHKAECYKVCNITDEDLIIREHCTPRCVNGAIESGKCKCYNGYFGNCCDTCPDAKYCENGGTCSMVGSNETCYCRMGYHGDRCQHIDQTSSTRATITTTKSMFAITPTIMTTYLTSTTPMTKATNLVTTLLGSTSDVSSSRRQPTTHTKPFIKYQNTMETTDTTHTRPKSFGTTKTSKTYQLFFFSRVKPRLC
ncbi:unnamed protein product [Mytilus edulis]|uniref:EGF-like domain-containing protein n=1 Tax=Mytilus edulis TaxID=6550 RepID=A0A8S3TVU1_MYTED|nr:unnamed protein product [Mytilus edulis]